MIRKLLGIDKKKNGWSEFYRKFEDRFRGSRETIYERICARYQTRLKGQCAKSASKRSLDLGCGRGEMLDLCGVAGFKSWGVDPFASMTRGVKDVHVVVNSDSLKFLRKQGDASFGLITSLHMVEHCAAEYNWEVISECFRVLEPGGAILIETPSLFSLWASSRQFYLDPTHTKPVHPDLLAFMMEERGFGKIEILDYDPVVSSDKPNFASLFDKAEKGEREKLEKWLYGPMDITLWAVKS